MKYLALVLSILILSIGTISAQIVTGEEVKEKTEDKVDQRVDRKVDESIDKGLDGLENLLFGKKKKKKKKDKEKDKEEEQASENENQGNPYGGLSGLFGGGDVDIEDSYQFDTETEILITTTKKKNKKSETMTYNMLFPDEGSYFGMELSGSSSSKEAPPTVAIFDMENYQMVNLVESDGQKMAMVIKLNEEEFNEKMNEQMEENSEDVSFRKTGRTKTIHGYSCDEYAVDSEDGEGTFWITDDSDLRIGMAMGSMAASQGSGSGMGSSQKGGFPMPENVPQGAILEMNFVENDGSTMKWETTNINTNANRTVSTNDYTIMNLGSGMGGGR